MKVSKYDSMLDKNGAVYLHETGTFCIDGRRVYSSPDALAEFSGMLSGSDRRQRNMYTLHVWTQRIISWAVLRRPTAL